MKVFISQPMSGLPDEEVAKVRDQAIEEIKNIYQFFERNNQLEIVSTTFTRDDEVIPENPSRLWWLGRAIQMLEGVDIIYFCKGWENSKGCKVEKLVATEHNIGTYYQK